MASEQVGEEIIGASEMIAAHQLINATSGKVEYFSPMEILEAATETMGFIDLDPASSDIANVRVGARKIFTKEDDGLTRAWRARTVWLNHPFAKGETKCRTPFSICTKETCKKRGYHIDSDIPSNGDWIQKLIREFNFGNFEQSCNITFAATSEVWFLPLLEYPQCYLHGRTNYVLPNGETLQGVTKGSVVTYLGPNVERFAEAYKRLGTVKIKYESAFQLAHAHHD